VNKIYNAPCNKSKAWEHIGKFHDAYNIEKLGTSHNTPDQSDFSIESTVAFILINDVLIMYCKLISFTFYPTFTVKLIVTADKGAKSRREI